MSVSKFAKLAMAWSIQTVYNIPVCIPQLGPNVYVGAGVVIGAGARVREALILDRAVIQVSLTSSL